MTFRLIYSKLKSLKNPTLADEAEVIESQLSSQVYQSLSYIEKALIAVGVIFLSSSFMIIVFSVAFSVSPISTAKWLGYRHRDKVVANVLGASTGSLIDNTADLNAVQAVMQPFGNVAVGVVKRLDKEAYDQLASYTILNVNDVLGMSDDGLVPEREIVIESSDILNILTDQVIDNLNSEYVQGKKPGNQDGDIAVLGEFDIPDIDTEGIVYLSDEQVVENKTINAVNNSITNLNNSNLSGSAGISNANLANSNITINSGTGISGGGSLALGGTLTLSNSGIVEVIGTSDEIDVSVSSGKATLSISDSFSPTISSAFSNITLTDSSSQLNDLTIPSGTDTLLGRDTVDTLTNKTISGATNTLSNIGNSSLANSSITVSAGSGLSGGGAVSLGSSVSISNAGVLSITGTTDQINASSSTGSITLSLPQDINTSSSPTFADLSVDNLDVGEYATVSAQINTGSISIGNGQPISAHLSATDSFDALGIDIGLCGGLGTITVTGASIGDSVVVTPTPTINGVEDLLLVWSGYVSAPDTVTIRGCSVATLAIQNPDTQTWRADVWKH